MWSWATFVFCSFYIRNLICGDATVSWDYPPVYLVPKWPWEHLLCWNWKTNFVNTRFFSSSSFQPLQAEIAHLCAWWPVVTMVTMGPVCLMKLTRKQKLVRTLGFFLDFFPQLISTTGSWDSPPMYLVTMVTMGPVWVCLIKLTRKRKLVRTLGFFLDFFSQLIWTTGSWDSPPVCLVTMGPVYPNLENGL